MRMIAPLLATLALASAARADFVVTGPTPLAPAQTPDPTNAAPEPSGDAATGDIPPPRLAPPQNKTAYGFGNQIPLSFAVKQIVPPRVRVVYGPGANPGTPVDWKGGAPWDRVLLTAVRPLGLHLVIAHGTVEIRK